jgi:hypothetical protein
VTSPSFRYHSKCVPFCLSGWAAVAFLMLCSSPAIAQQTLGAINGTVTDSSGAVVQGATVKVRSQATNLEVKAETKADGSFNIGDLPIGTYEATRRRSQ